MLDQVKTTADTLPKLLLHHYKEYGTSKVALREKDRGIWVKYTWADYYSIVHDLALGFFKLGLGNEEKVSIIGENKPHVYWFELAAQVCGAAVTGIFSDCSASEIKYFVEHSDSTFVVCQDQEQVDKLLDIKSEIPNVKKVIYWDKKGMWDYDDPILIDFDGMREIGRKVAAEEPGLCERMIGQTRGDDVAVLFYSSGTTGVPKAAIQTHANIISMARLADETYPVERDEESVSFLPIAWIAEQLYNVTYSLFKGFAVNFPERQETVQENIREVGPQTLLLSPRLWEDHIRTIRVKMTDAGFFQRLSFNRALAVGYHVGDLKMKGADIPLLWKFLYFFANGLVLRPLKDRLGLSRARLARTAGTGISPDVIRYFHAIGVPLVQLYGSSEAGIVTMHPPDQIKSETCGKPLEGCDIRISDEGEIVIKSSSIFKGYYKDPEKTQKVLKKGWYHTGDFGRFDEDNHLIVMDRMEDLQKISGGKVFSPQFAEIRMRFSPYIKDVLVIGREDEPFATAILNIDYNNVGNWAEAKHIIYTTFSDLSQKGGVIELLKHEISTVNGYLPVWAKIKKFISLHKEFDPDENEMTRTRKVRRNFMEEKYEELIDALYTDNPKIDITASVTYRDGSKGEIKSSILINTVD